MSKKHTPGPWWTSNLEVGDVPMMNTKVARVSGASFEEAKANGRLIAAAPELLEALRGLLSLHEPEGRFQPSHFKPVLRQAREAIAKATGEPVSEIGTDEYRYRQALVEIANGATGYLDNDTTLANIAKRALRMEVEE